MVICHRLAGEGGRRVVGGRVEGGRVEGGRRDGRRRTIKNIKIWTVG